MWETLKYNGKTYINYEVSVFGEIRNAKTKRLRKLVNNTYGYLKCNIQGITMLVHRVVGCTFVELDTTRPEINHKDGNKENNSVWNLEWMTRVENVIHAHNIGLSKHPKGFKSKAAKFNEEQVDIIRKLYAAGKTLRELAKTFNCHHSTIGYITQGKTYGH